MILYHARWVLPITSPPIENGTVAVSGGRITWVGNRDESPDGEDHDLGDVLLLPGLINAHTHLELTAMRGFLEDLDFRRWILRLTSGKRAVLDRDALLDSARYGGEEGIAAGITTYADTCDSGLALDAMLEYGVRGIVYQEVFGPDPVQRDDAMRDLRRKVAEMRARETPLVRVGVSPHAPYTVSDDLFRATARFAAEESLPVAVHIAESDVETRLVVDASGTFADGLRTRGIEVVPRAESPVRLLATLGVLDLRPLLIHCVRVDARDIADIAAARSPVAHCPASNAKLGHGIAPLAEFMAAGIDVALGSDSVASNNRMDILEEARLALLMQRGRLESPQTPSADEVLQLATICGAAALGLESEVGSLDVGKSADLAAFSIRGVGPVQDPVAAAVFSLGGARATFVAVAGEPLLDDGRLLRPHPGLESRVQRAADALRDWLAAGGELVAPPASGVR